MRIILALLALMERATRDVKVGWVGGWEAEQVNYGCYELSRCHSRGIRDFLIRN